MARILIVDDEERIGFLLSETLNDLGHRASYETAGERALERIRAGGFDLVITDLRMEPVDGMEIVRAVTEAGGTEVVVLTAHGSTASAVAAMKAGAIDYLQKPLDLDEMTIWIQRWTEARRREARTEQLSADLAALTEDEFIGEAAPVRELRSLIERVARKDTTVLILGESGTGKELVARAIHRASPRAARPFVATNCAALTETLLESELFGHEKGAFTGAYKQRIGRFELAEGGTLFLDEIGEISGGFQAKLLRALEQHEIVRVGAAEPVRVDVRVIAATNKSLQAEVNAGRFRSDLFFRLNVFPITVPPLKERISDIGLLAEHFLKRLRYEHPHVSADVLRALQTYHWPGNIRELRNILERATILAGGAPIAGQHLGFLPSPESPPAMAVTSGASLPESPASAGGLGDVEKGLIEEALRLSRGNKSDAARRLGITRRVLYTKMRRHDLK
ncbi:MAG: sigma-54 dependent transcriptional regulator [Candidatus Zixiibacteriota bacterium]